MFGIGKSKVLVKATVVADEGYGMADNSATVALQHQKYIIDVHPDDEPAFRTEVKVWVSWTSMPKVGDVVSARYKPGTKDAEIVIAGDSRFDWKLINASKESADAAHRKALLDAPPDSRPPTK